MPISAETFHSIVKSVRARSQQTLPPGFVGSAIIVPRTDKNSSRPIDVLVRDLAPGEISFVHSKTLKTGESFLLCVREGAQTRAIVCVVSRWHPLGDGKVSITAAFAREAVSFSKVSEGCDVDLEHVKSIEAKLRAATEP